MSSVSSTTTRHSSFSTTITSSSTSNPFRPTSWIKLASKLGKLPPWTNTKFWKKWAPSKIIWSRRTKKYGILSTLPTSTPILSISTSSVRRARRKKINFYNSGKKSFKASEQDKSHKARRLATTSIHLRSLCLKFMLKWEMWGLSWTRSWLRIYLSSPPRLNSIQQMESGSSSTQ